MEGISRVSKLDDTKDFISLYLHHVGISEVPQQWHLWACISLLAAAVADRVWVPLGPRKVYPNLYVFLLGESGSGKEFAINTAAELAAIFEVINLYAGSATKQALFDEMGKGATRHDGQRIVANPKLYLVTEELAMVAGKEQTDDLINFMTAIYKRPKYPITDGTRQHGQIMLQDPCPNWLAGSTNSWLVKRISKQDIEGGFFARVMSIPGERSWDDRHHEIVFPDDYQEIRDHLAWRVAEYTWLEGPFPLTDKAKACHKDWYKALRKPEDKLLLPAYHRADEMVYRLSLIMALGEIYNRYDERAIDVQHIEEGIELWESVALELPGVLHLAASTIQTNHIDIIARFIKHRKVIEHSTLLKLVGNHGMNAHDFKKAIETLKGREEITEEGALATNGRTKVVYRWTVEA